MKAIRAGAMVFGASSADVLPSHDVLVYGATDTVKPSSIEYIASELLILENGEGEFWDEDGFLDADLVADLVSKQDLDVESLDHFFADF
jgi:hypothetical protein